MKENIENEYHEEFILEKLLIDEERRINKKKCFVLATTGRKFKRVKRCLSEKRKITTIFTS